MDWNELTPEDLADLVLGRAPATDARRRQAREKLYRIATELFRGAAESVGRPGKAGDWWLEVEKQLGDWRRPEPLLTFLQARLNWVVRHWKSSGTFDQRQKRRESAPLDSRIPDPGPTVTAQVTAAEDYARMIRAYETYKAEAPKKAAVFAARLVKGQTYQEIAAKLKISVSTAHAWEKEAQARIREILKRR